MKKPPDGFTEDQSKGIVCLHVVLAAFMAVCVLQAVFKYHPNPGDLISPIPHFGLLVGLIIPVGAVLFVVFMEIIFVGYRNSSWHHLFVKRRDQSVGYDLFFYLLHIFRIRHLVFIYFTLGLYLYAEQFKGEFIGAAVAWGGRFSTGFPAVDIVLFVFVWSFFDYWNHRVQHTPLLWPLHRLHHSATTLTLFTSHRNNPFLLLFEPFVRVWPYIILLPEPMHLFMFGTFNYTYQLLVHSNLRSDWGWFGRWVLISPAAHRIHHSDSPDHYGKNLSVAVIWDRIFGTWIEPTEQSLTLGIREAGHNGGNLIKDVYADVFLFLQGALTLFSQAAVSLVRLKTLSPVRVRPR